MEIRFVAFHYFRANFKAAYKIRWTVLNGFSQIGHSKVRTINGMAE